MTALYPGAPVDHADGRGHWWRWSPFLGRYEHDQDRCQGTDRRHLNAADRAQVTDVMVEHAIRAHAKRAGLTVSQWLDVDLAKVAL